MTDCIFCKIAKGNVPCYKIYEDEKVLAFLDIANDFPGHTLVIPKKHTTNFLSCDDETLKHIMLIVKKIGLHFVEKCGFDSVNTLTVGEDVQHFHVHILPRKKDDGFKVFPHYGDCGLDLKELADKLKIKKG